MDGFQAGAGLHIERPQLRTAIGIHVLGHRLQRRGEWRVGDDEDLGHGVEC